MRTVSSFYHRLAIAGASLTTTGVSMYAALAIPAGDPRAPLFAPLALILLGIAAVMYRTPKALWLAVVAGPFVLSIQALDNFRLMHPDSFIDFFPSVLAVAGTATAFGASAVALWQRRRGIVRDANEPERIGVVLGVAALVAVATFSGIATFTRSATITLPGGRTATVVSTDEDRWVPDALSAPADATNLVYVRNPDWIAHTFSVPEFGIDVYIAPRTDRTIEVRLPSPGTYRFECSVTGHEMMIGTLRVS